MKKTIKTENGTLVPVRTGATFKVKWINDDFCVIQTTIKNGNQPFNLATFNHESEAKAIIEHLYDFLTDHNRDLFIMGIHRWRVRKQRLTGESNE